MVQDCKSFVPRLGSFYMQQVSHTPEELLDT